MEAEAARTWWRASYLLTRCLLDSPAVWRTPAGCGGRSGSGGPPGAPAGESVQYVTLIELHKTAVDKREKFYEK